MKTAMIAAIAAIILGEPVAQAQDVTTAPVAPAAETAAIAEAPTKHAILRAGTPVVCHGISRFLHAL